MGDRGDFYLVCADVAQLLTRRRSDSLSGTAPPSTAVMVRLLGLGWTSFVDLLRIVRLGGEEEQTLA